MCHSCATQPEQMVLGPSPEPVKDTQMVLLLGEAQIGGPIHSQSQVFEFADAEPECDTKCPCQPALSTNY
jgi:hypothetical protein